MSNQVQWFVAGLVLIVILGLYVPKLAGWLLILIATVLAIRIARKNLL